MSDRASSERPCLVSRQSIANHLGEVLRSQTFSSSERLRSFLRFIVEKALVGEAHALKEYVIGVDVFGRSEGYDPRLDPIVRVHARKLRDRLREYYAMEGVQSQVRIDLPKGAYLPVFTNHHDRCEPSLPLSNESLTVVPDAHRRSFWGASRNVALLVLVLTLLAFTVIIRVRDRHPTAPRSIVVLPFVNRSSHANDEYISDNLTEELTNALARRTHLHVVGRTSAFTFKQTAVDVRKIGKTLNVDAVIEGSLRRTENGFRLTIQIVDTAQGYQLWSGTCVRPAEELYALQEDLETAVVTALDRDRDARTPGNAPPIRNIHAYNSYLLGRFYSNKLDPRSLRTAAAYYEAAVRAEPRFAAAWAGLAGTRSAQFIYGDEQHAMEQARVAAWKALQIDPNSSEAASALAWIKGTYDYDWSAAEQLYRQALHADPDNAAARSAFGITHLAPLGRLKEACREVQRALELDPLSLRINNAMALCYYYMRRYDEAINQFRRTIDLDQNFALAHLYLGYVYAEKSMYPEAVDALKAQPVHLWEGPNLGALGYVYARWNRLDESRTLLRIWNSRASSMTASARAGSAVWFYLGLNNRDQVFEWLAKAVDHRWFWVNSLKIRPMFDPIRSDPRYNALLRKMHIPE